MRKFVEWSVLGGVWALVLASSMTAMADSGGPRQVVPARLPAVVRSLHALGAFPGTNQLSLAIGLPARHPAELAAFLKRLQDPTSPDYHHYLTPGQFAEQFGPSAADYQAVVDFAETNGLRVTGRQVSRLVLDVTGAAADIEKTFQVKLHVYRHPTEARTFYAPDADPSVAGSLRVTLLSISGLDNYSRPQPASLQRAPARSPGASPNTGSGSGGTYFGKDFREAYVPGTKLNGNGQSVALLEFDGYYASDIAAYNAEANMTNVPLVNIAVNGGVNTPGSGNAEVSLDIEMATAMAPGLAEVLVYEAPEGTPWTMILGQIADDNLAKQVSSSWGGGPNPNPEGEFIFQQMAAQGQSFFNASGDDDAYTGTPPFPMDSPNITEVGGTTLSTAGQGTRVLETVWNAGLDANTGAYLGSGGGVSLNYGIPTWQLGISSFATNGGSLAARNVPDVAMVADNVFVTYGNGQSEPVVGTSCAAPLWAGFMALVNQKAAAAGLPPAGFINPAVYEIANESTYGVNFFDVIEGNNVSGSSPNAYYARKNYDLCTGLGTPKGTNLINSLASPDPLVVVSNAGFRAVGTAAGTFNITAQTFFLTNAGSALLAWSLVNTSAWLVVSKASGTLAPGAGDQTTASLNTVASNLPAATYNATLSFSNLTSRVGHYRFFSLTTADPLQIEVPVPLNFAIQPGNPATPAMESILLTNPSPNLLSWSVINTSLWLAVTPSAGTLAPNTQSILTVAPTWFAGNLADGLYAETLRITNATTHHAQSVPANLDVGLVQNGGFETGDFTDWILNGNTNANGTVYNEVVSAGTLTDGSGGDFVHSGTYGAFLGDTNLALLAQTVPTVPGQNYVFSFWLANPETGSGQQFLAEWNSGGGGPNQIYYITNPPVLAWTNLSFTETATGTNTTVVFGAENPPDGFGLDDVTVDLVAAPGFASEPTNLTVAVGATATFSAVISGTVPITCQWFQNGVSLTNGPGIAGANTPTLTLAGVGLGSTGLYTLAITNALGSAASLGASLTVEQPPSITGVAANPDGSITLTLTGTPGLTYVLETATNLAPPVTWLPINTNVPVNNQSWEFTDEQATNFPQQFYRVESAQ